MRYYIGRRWLETMGAMKGGWRCKEGSDARRVAMKGGNDEISRNV